MFFKKKDEEAPELESAEEAAAAPAEEAAAAPAEEAPASAASEDAPTLEQVIDQRNAVITQLQLQLGALRENAALQEQQALALIAKAREELRASVQELAAERGIDIDDGRWNFDLTSKEFSKIN